MGRRRAITPAFHFKILEQFVEVFDRNSAILVKSIGKFKPTDPVDVFPLITLAALDIICGKIFHEPLILNALELNIFLQQ